MYLIFDTETTGLPKDFKKPHTDLDNWPRLVQIAWQLHDKHGNLLNAANHIIKPEGFTIPYNAEKVHGISTQRALDEGEDLAYVLDLFAHDITNSQVLIGHNIEFDLNIMGAEFIRGEVESKMWETDSYCTKEATTDFVQIPGGKGGKFKWPTLTELHVKLFGEAFADAHDAAYDVDATSRCFFGLITQEWYEPLEGVSFSDVIYEPPVLDDANFAVTTASTKSTKKVDTSEGLAKLEGVSFTHLHNHTQYSVLQATTEIGNLVKKAVDEKMPAVTMTDHGNMMAAFHFVKAVLGHNKGVKAANEEAIAAGKEPTAKELKPIVGCEFYVCEDHEDKTRKDNGYQIPMLAKNKSGYHNLAKMSSIAHVTGYYYVPRIDKKVVEQYKGEVIVTTGGINGEVPNLILNVGEEQAEQALVWWKEQFGDDLYIELMRHGLEEEDRVNEILLQFAAKYDIKYIAANNNYYLNKEDANAHDILLCVKEGEKKSTPIGRGRGFRNGFPNQEFYFKTEEEMKKLFHDLPDAIVNTNEIVDKVEPYELARDVLLPEFDIPQEFVDERDKEDGGKRGENAYLRHLTYEGAAKRYDEITDDIRERLDFELATIERTGYPGYFLIVQDFTSAARDMGVSVGPGRGSAAGSAAAYCIGITNVDPIKYDLLFERFLNPDRVSLPDIDIDFDDRGRDRIIEWVVDKYGANQVAQIITYGTMAAKSSIRDTARVLDLPLPDADRIAKLVPDMKLKKLFGLSDEALEEKLNPEQMTMATELKEISAGTDLSAQTLNQARILEGSVRNTGIHACGVIITPDDITKYVPVASAKDSDLYVTQFDNSVVEDAGLLKMDFLGLKTLTLINDALAIVKELHGIDIDPDEIPLDDPKTYELFQKGETVGIFQYESPGMQKHMKDLKPDTFADLIAMNALYRPGPLQYIPNFIGRKHGREEITYDLDAMSEYLEETYGITVYQEQVMLLSQSLAGFTKGEADVLRKAMGKKIFSLLEKLKPKFLDGCEANGHDRKIAEKVWTDWEAFAAYAFNKSHSTCYAYVAFQTAYLKANYPAEYMASVLSNNMNDITQVTFFMDECRRMELPVLGPDVNESKEAFFVNKEGQIRFGLAAIKGAGGAAVQAIIEERDENGPYKDFFDFGERVNLRAVNKKTLEVLAMSGAFDCFPDNHRKQYLIGVEGESNLIELVVKYANKMNSEKDSNQASLFGGGSAVDIPKPKVSPQEEYSQLERLALEKDVIGLYISGHPLDQFKLEIESFCTCTCAQIDNYRGRDIKIAGIVTKVQERQTKSGKPFGLFSVEDYEGSQDLAMFGEEYMKSRHLISPGEFIYLRGQVQERYNQPGLWEFRPLGVELLSEVRDKMCKGLKIEIDLDFLTEGTMSALEQVFLENTGKLSVKINVFDRAENITIDMLSRKYTVEASNDLLDVVEHIDGVSCKVLS